MQPLVSVIIPTYNRAPYLVQALDSLLTQSYQNWECLVVDDGSTDITHSLCTKYESKDNRIKFLIRSVSYQEGGNGARNMGWRNCNGDLVIFLDSDDLLSQECIKTRVDQYERFPADMSIFTTFTFIEEPGDREILWNYIGNKYQSYSEFILRFIEQDMPWHTNAVLWRRDFLLKLGGWNEDLRAWQDWEMHLRALFHEPAVEFYPDVQDNFYRVEVKGSIASGRDNGRYYLSVFKAIKSIEPFVQRYGDTKTVRRFKYLILRMFIYRPIRSELKFLPFKVFFSRSFSVISKITLIKFYLLDLLLRRIRTDKLKIVPFYSEYRKRIIPKSTHLSLEKDRLSRVGK